MSEPSAMPSAIAIKKIDGRPGQVYYPLERITITNPTPKPNQVVLKLSAAALNHRDLFIRQHLYPGVTFGVPLLADGSATVVATGSDAEARKWLGKKVILNPGTGWDSDPDGPEHPKGYAILGGTKLNPLGTLAESIVVDAYEIEEAPSHLSSIEAAALPLTGLTGWRATFTKNASNMKPGRNILITGIGGGVALMALMFCVAAGCNVYVSSGSEDKIEKAKKLGAKGGINYKNKEWVKDLIGMLPNDRKLLDGIIDGAGGDVCMAGAKLLKPGGIISSYGMTLGPKITFPMSAVLKNIEVRGSTMGSRKEFADMVAFVREKKLTPVVSRVVSGMDNIEAIDGLFEDMKNGSQFGKLVIEISKDGTAEKL